jgi:hypothetical protein
MEHSVNELQDSIQETLSTNDEVLEVINTQGVPIDPSFVHLGSLTMICKENWYLFKLMAAAKHFSH